jgi:hypothetical protein
MGAEGFLYFAYFARGYIERFVDITEHFSVIVPNPMVFSELAELDSVISDCGGRKGIEAY